MVTADNLGTKTTFLMLRGYLLKSQSFNFLIRSFSKTFGPPMSNRVNRETYTQKALTIFGKYSRLRENFYTW